MFVFLWPPTRDCRINESLFDIYTLFTDLYKTVLIYMGQGTYCEGEYTCNKSTKHISMRYLRNFNSFRFPEIVGEIVRDRHRVLARVLSVRTAASAMSTCSLIRGIACSIRSTSAAEIFGRPKFRLTPPGPSSNSLVKNRQTGSTSDRT